MCAWSDSFLQLQDRGIVTGFALITARGPLQPATGAFQAECAQGISQPVQQLVRSFYSASDPPTSYELWGSKLLVVHQTDSCFVAVSKQRQLGIVAVNLPSGVLLVSFSRPAAAAAKLHRQQLQHLQQLQELLDEMQAAVQDMQAALEGVTSQLSEGAPWQRSLPVFHCLALPESAALLQQLLQMHSQELAVQQGMLQSFSGLVQEAGSCLQEGATAAQPNSRALSVSSSKAAGSAAGRRAGVRSVEDCRKLLTAGITTWMVRPCIDEGCMEQLLQLLTDEMAGF
ncbi:hypothetical protein OEZ86_008714 [Tetradesmus obliquus]|nr:hypothetical protein OEZ86_008714 [Tetradesmus obliquus]